MKTTDTFLYFVVCDNKGFLMMKKDTSTILLVSSPIPMNIRENLLRNTTYHDKGLRFLALVGG